MTIELNDDDTFEDNIKKVVAMHQPKTEMQREDPEKKRKTYQDVIDKNDLFEKKEPCTPVWGKEWGSDRPQVKPFHVPNN